MRGYELPSQPAAPEMFSRGLYQVRSTIVGCPSPPYSYWYSVESLYTQYQPSAVNNQNSSFPQAFLFRRTMSQQQSLQETAWLAIVSGLWQGTKPLSAKCNIILFGAVSFCCGSSSIPQSSTVSFHLCPRARSGSAPLFRFPTLSLSPPSHLSFSLSDAVKDRVRRVRSVRIRVLIGPLYKY